MQRIFWSQGLHRHRSVLADFALTVAIMLAIFLPTSVFSLTWQEEIEQKMLILKDSEEHWLEIDLTEQRLIAWEGKQPVYAVIISTGKKNTPTPPGIFTIQSKHRQGRMRGADYDIPDVPYVMYYHKGYAIHGAYWHKNFGVPVSHGCTNVAVDHAEWLFNWTSLATPVIIHY
jgi:lipoprotein-anchoring transpeptidase ErfK/SrfK